MHHIVLWKWNQPGFRVKYEAEYVNIIADSVRRHVHDLPVRILCITDDPKGIDPTKCDVAPLWGDHDKLANRSGSSLPSCYRRLKLFDAATQSELGIEKGSRIVSLDLDSIITNDLRPLLAKKEHFVGWAVRGQNHLRVFNGSMWMFTAGTHQEMWDRFDPIATPERVHRAGFLGSDQSWLSYNFAKDPTAGNWSYPHVVSYPREVARRLALSRGTAVVCFHGRRKPWMNEVHNESPWVKTHFVSGLSIPVYTPPATRPARGLVQQPARMSHGTV